MTGYLIIDAIVAYALLGSTVAWVAIIPVCRRIGALERGVSTRERNEQMRAKGLV